MRNLAERGKLLSQEKYMQRQDACPRPVCQTRTIVRVIVVEVVEVVKVCQRLTPGATRNPERTRQVPRNPDPEQLCGFPDPARSRPDCRQPGVKDLT